VFLALVGGVVYLWLQPDQVVSFIDRYSTHTIKDETEYYHIHAMHPKLDHEEFDNKILAMVNSEIDHFKESVDKHGHIKDFHHELNIHYKTYNLGHLYSIEFIIYKNLGGEATNKNPVYYFDNKLNKEILFDDLFTNPSRALSALSELAHAELKDNPNYDEEDLKKALEVKKDNFRTLIFTNEKIILGIPAHRLGEDSTELIQVNLKYDDMDKYLVYKGHIRDPKPTPTTPSHPNQTQTPSTTEEGRVVRDIEKLRAHSNFLMITFDDGPAGAITTRLLDELSKRDVKVTFFALGTRIQSFPNIVKRAFAEGHTVASHTWSHRNLNNMSATEVQNEVNQTNQALFNTLGIHNRFVRPPYGNANAAVRAAVPETIFINWDIDPEDWKDRNADLVYQRITEGAAKGTLSLSHDLYNTSVDGVIRAVDTLLSQGFALISLEEAEKLGFINMERNPIFSLRLH